MHIRNNTDRSFICTKCPINMSLKFNQCGWVVYPTEQKFTWNNILGIKKLALQQLANTEYPT